MKFQWGHVPLILLYVGSLLACTNQPISSDADKYYTWVDDQGRVQSTLIKAEKNPLIKDDNKVLSSNEQTLPPATEATPAPKTVEEDNSSKSPQDSSSKISSSKIRSSENRSPKTDDQYDLTQVNENDFIDGDELERNNFVRKDDKPRYYTWVDGEGRMVNTPIKPDDVRESKSAESTPVLNSKFWELSSFKQRSAFENLVKTLPKNKNVDAIAAQIFDLDSDGNDYSWQKQYLPKNCCDELAHESIYELEALEPLLVEVNKFSEVANYQSGKSPYELIRVPAAREDYFVRIRTFINKSVFVPVVVFLNGEFKPTRIISELSLEFFPADWAFYAHLEAVVDVRYKSLNERYVMLLTTSDLLKETVPVKNPRGKVENIKYTKYGDIELYTKTKPY